MMNDHSWGWGMGGNYWTTPLVAVLVVAVIILAIYLIKNRLKK